MNLQEEVNKLEAELKQAIKEKEWDIPKEAPILFFDPELSYELTGYKPINKTKGLDFDPSWFTEARETYEKTGKYCAYLPGSKKFREFWKEQYKRCKYGMTVNGYTITGFHYFFLNYYTLPLVTKVQEAGKGRPEGFPSFTVAQYIWFHYLALCCKLLKNAALMKARGIGFSEINAAMAAAEFTTIRESNTVITCHDEGKLRKTLKKAWHALAFLDKNTQGGMSKNKQIKNTDLEKTSGAYIMDHGTKIPTGWQSTILGIVADDPQKIRGDRADFLLYDEAGCHAPGTKILMANGQIKNVEDIVINDLLMGDDGTPRKVIELHHGQQPMYKITLENGDTQIVNENHILYGKRYIYHKKKYTDFEIKVKDFWNMIKNSPRKQDGYKIVKSNKVSFKEQEVPLDPYLFGFWLGDGNSDSPRFTSEDPEILEYLSQFALQNNMKISISNCNNTKNCKHIYLGKGDNKENIILKALQTLNVINNKHIPDCYLYNSKEVLLQLLAGFIDADGTYNKTKHCVEFTQSEAHTKLMKQLAFICRTLGMRISVDQRISKNRQLGEKCIKGGVIQHRIRINYGHEQIPTKIKRKQSKDRIDGYKSIKDRNGYTFKLEPYKECGEYYGFSLDGNQLFLLEDFTICHNSWPGLETAVTQGEALVEIGGVRFGVMVFGGTGGDKGTNLEGLRKIYYNPLEYNVLPYRHNYTEGGEIVETGFFIPAYQQMYEYLDSRGWCDPEKTKPILQNKRNAKLNNPKAYLEHCSEYCWTAEEAFAQEGQNKFNKALIAEQLTRIRALKIGPRPQAGRLMPVYKNDKCKFKEIENFRWIPDQLSKLQILEHPIWSDLYREQQNKERQKAESSGKNYEEDTQVYETMQDLYIAGIDGIDIGQAQTSKDTKDPSDFCIVIKKRAFGMQEPIIVAMYKDRPQDINTAYKIAMCICKYYNAKINVEATRVGLLNWAKKEGLLSYFMRRPRATLADIRSGNTKSYGTPATGAIIEMQTDLVATYVEDYSHNIWFEEILDELQKYNPENKRKFDIVASLGMVELADQELSARVPIKVEKNTDDKFQDFGYWRDSKGYLHKGIIPKKEKQEIKYAEFREDREAYDPFAIETSDTRYHSLFVQEGLYRTNTYQRPRPYRV